MPGCRHLRLHHVLGVAGLLAAALVLLRFRAITSQVAQAEHLIQVTRTSDDDCIPAALVTLYFISLQLNHR